VRSSKTSMKPGSATINATQDALWSQIVKTGL
jgi:hypothetical protein